MISINFMKLLVFSIHLQVKSDSYDVFYIVDENSGLCICYVLRCGFVDDGAGRLH